MAKGKDLAATKIGQKVKLGGLPKPKGMAHKQMIPNMGHHSRPAGVRGKKGVG